MRNARVTLTLFAAFISVGALVLIGIACSSAPKGVQTDPAVSAEKFPHRSFDGQIEENADELLKQGREIFRYDTFGSEAFWGDKLQLHRAILRDKKGGISAGLTARQALQAGLKADSGKVPKLLVEVLKEGATSLDDPDTTLELLRAGAVVGVKGFFDEKKNLRSIGITCALCHSTVDD